MAEKGSENGLIVPIFRQFCGKTRRELEGS